MPDATTPDAPPNRPGPTPDPATTPAPPPSRSTRLVGLLRKLIQYGLDLAHLLQQRPPLATIATLAMHFGTRDIALILMRISRGLQLAGALDDKLFARPLREIVARASVRTPVARKPRATRRPPLPDMPTAEEIAAALRNRPAGAVIADICRDLGIVPAHPLWREVMAVLAEYRGNFTKLFKSVTKRLTAWFTDPSWRANEGWAAVEAQAEALWPTVPP